MNNLPNVGNSDFNTGSTNRNDTYIPHQETKLGENYNRNSRLNIDEENKGNYSSNNYEKVFNKLNISDGQENINYKKRNNYLVISSKDRDLSIYPKSNNFVINLDTEYKNITSIELIQAIIPDKNSVTSEPLLLLNINELDPVMQSNNKQIYDSFAILQMSQPTTAGGFIHTMKQIHEHVLLQYRTPKARLSKLTFSITDIDGNLFEFGGNNTTTKDYQCQFIFKIITLDTDRDVINQRNVY